MDWRSSWIGWLGFWVQEVYTRHILGVKKALERYFGCLIQVFGFKTSLDLLVQWKCDGSAAFNHVYINVVVSKLI